MDKMIEAVEKVQLKKNKLISFVYSVLNNEHHKENLTKLRNKLGIGEEQIIQSFLDYNLDIFGFGNEIYNSISNRFILHIHNLLEGSWHGERQKAVIKLLNTIKITSAIDIGFGVPTRYIQNLVLPSKAPKTTLCDLFDTSIQFASALLEQWDKNWYDTISFKQADMCNVEEVCGDYDVYLFQDSIEHVEDPTNCLKQYVALSHKHSYFILSIPIHPIIPAHYIEWKDDEDAIKWLKECGLVVLNKIVVKTNPQVDLFADSLGPEHHNLIVLCAK